MGIEYVFVTTKPNGDPVVLCICAESRCYLVTKSDEGELFSHVLFDGPHRILDVCAEDNLVFLNYHCGEDMHIKVLGHSAASWNAEGAQERRELFNQRATLSRGGLPLSAPDLWREWEHIDTLSLRMRFWTDQRDLEVNFSQMCLWSGQLVVLLNVDYHARLSNDIFVWLDSESGQLRWMLWPHHVSNLDWCLLSSSSCIFKHNDVVFVVLEDEPRVETRMTVENRPLSVVRDASTGNVFYRTSNEVRRWTADGEIIILSQNNDVYDLLVCVGSVIVVCGGGVFIYQQAFEANVYELIQVHHLSKPSEGLVDRFIGVVHDYPWLVSFGETMDLTFLSATNTQAL
jgi:hypothetical protein